MLNGLIMQYHALATRIDWKPLSKGHFVIMLVPMVFTMEGFRCKWHSFSRNVVSLLSYLD